MAKSEEEKIVGTETEGTETVEAEQVSMESDGTESTPAVQKKKMSTGKKLGIIGTGLTLVGLAVWGIWSLVTGGDASEVVEAAAEIAEN